MSSIYGRNQGSALVRVPASHCLECDKELDSAVSQETTEPPAPGDVTICMYCGHLMVFGETGALREPSGKEIVDLAGEQHHLKMMRMRAAYWCAVRDQGKE